MPALPWLERQPIDPQRQYVAMASRLPLKSYRFIPGFMRDTMRIRRQLGQATELRRLHAERRPCPKDVLDVLGLGGPGQPGQVRSQRPPPRHHRAAAPADEPDAVRVFPISGSDLPLTWAQITARVS